MLDDLTTALGDTRYRTLVEALSTVIWTADRTGAIVEPNAGWAALTGQTWEQYRGFGWLDAVHAEDRAHLRELWRTVQPDQTVSVAYRVRRHDGEYRNIISRGVLIIAGDGSIAECLGSCIDVTEATRSRDALTDSEQRLRTIVETAAEGIWMTDASGVGTFVNPRMAAMLGYSPEEMIGRSYQMFVQPDEVQRADAGFAMRREGDEQRKEYRMRHRDGSTVWVAVTASALRGRDGAVQGVIAMFTDITAQKRVEEEARATREQIAAVLESITDGFIALDSQWRFTFVNSAAEAMTGLCRSDLIGRNIWDALPELRNTAVEREYRRAVEHRFVTDFEHFYQPWQKWFRVRCHPCAGGGLSIYMIDVTDIRVTEAALHVSEARFRTVFELAAVGIAAAAIPDGRFIAVNQRLAEITGFSIDELLQRTFIDITHPDDRAGNRVVFQDLVDGRIKSYAYEKRYVRKDGTFVWVQTTISLVRDSEGRAMHTIGVVEDITARREAENALRQHARLLDLSHEPILAWNLNRAITFWNRGAELLYGWSREEALGQPIQALLQTEHPVPVEEIDASVRQTGSWVGELIHTARNGRKVVVESRKELVQEPGSLPIVLETNRDITDRKRIEESLRESEARFRQIAEAAPLTVWVADPSGVAEYCNTRWFTYTGQSPEEVLGPDAAGWAQVVHPDDLESCISLWAWARASGSPYEVEARLRRYDGDWRWFLMRGLPVRDTAGHIVRWVGANIDIHDRREAERTLRESEERLSSLISATTSVLWTAGPDGHFMGPQPAWEHYTGQRWPEYALGGGLTAIHPDDQDGVRSAWQRAVATSTPFEFEYRLWHAPTQEYRHTIARSVPVRNSDGSVREWVGSSDDIHERRLAERALRQSNEALRRANAALEQFAWAAAHDLQEPARNIALYAQLLQRRYSGNFDAQGNDFLCILSDSSLRMLNLIQDLLSYTRATDDVPRGASAADPQKAVAEVIQNLRTAIDSACAQITFGSLPDKVKVHHVHLVQILQNLISNALKYRTAAAPRVHVSAESDRNAWTFSVTDNGQGIAPDFHERIFGVFKRLHGRTVPGTGIGLAICERIVTHYGGRIWVESQEGRGATFRFTVPMP